MLYQLSYVRAGISVSPVDRAVTAPSPVTRYVDG